MVMCYILNTLVNQTTIIRRFNCSSSWFGFIPMLNMHPPATNAAKHPASHEVILRMVGIASGHLGIDLKLTLCLFPGVTANNGWINARWKLDNIFIRQSSSFRVFCPDAVVAGAGVCLSFEDLPDC